LIQDQLLLFNGTEIKSEKLLSDYGVKDGDLLLVDKRPSESHPQQQQQA